MRSSPMPVSIDGRGNGNARAGWAFLELHEHQVPDLDEPVAIFVGRTGRPAGDRWSMVVEDLRTRPARSGIAHPPEIVRAGDPDDPVIAETGHLAPDPHRLVVFRVYGHHQAVLGEGKILGDQLPGIRDRLLLEVVAKTEIPQHLEKRVMPRGVADIVEVVVLAAGAHAFLRRRGTHVVPLLLAGEHVLELHHARVGEHQRGIIARHQRRALDHAVFIAGEVVEEGGADVVAAGHGTLARFPGMRNPRT